MRFPGRSAKREPDAPLLGRDVSTKEKLVLDTAEAIEIFIHPFHAKIMETLRIYDEPMTVKEIADALGQTPARIHYHVKKLLSIGVLRLDHTRTVNGIVAKYYALTPASVALKVPEDDPDKKEDLESRIQWEYGALFDRVKQGYYDLFSQKDIGVSAPHEVVITSKEAVFLDPDDLEAIGDEFSKILERYQRKGENAVPHRIFLSMFPNVRFKNDKEKPET